MSSQTDRAPVIWWVRRDLRLSDNRALVAAVETGAPVIPVFLCDPILDSLGAAPKWRFGLGAAALDAALRDRRSRLIYRKGDALETLRALVSETGAETVYWSRAYDPDQVARDKAVKSGLQDDGVDARSFTGHLLIEPWTVETGSGGFYKVYTPFWKAVRDRAMPEPQPAPDRIPAPDNWPESDRLDYWALGAAMNRGAAIVAPHLAIGEDAARGRLGAFIAHRVEDYDRARDIPGIEGTSRLSENLTYGEIGPATCWQAGQRALAEGKAGAETFLKELVWREFAYHLVWHTPHLIEKNWRAEWDDFPWRDDNADAEAWRRGRTGIRFVDAAMREMYVTGTMHNRGRMIVASYLTKHLMTHWRVGQAWFDDCLVDWDPASNAMGWQWAAGSGPDAAPYFRVFNPDTQLDKFDRDQSYQRRFIAEGQGTPPEDARAYFDAIPRSWGLSPDDAYPDPIVPLDEGRKRALDAYQARKDAA
ncbi:deoxyribodipyrimidine photo-lyase [Dinoroseobacter sp. PD6]|uniref:cryptochrome/photolyase family protein n=1 Tax=Dinoroseobacter sp. PD6 TaxID=3028384 RepID=UPI00237ACAAA|nr:deoxyribodipyrimidine photo-lyase [Dinoroseobacter sp. PD6]MDD9716436.1 deoxyribodipyrimidine photo-lyase [Dinoroseobacter sp. PD6]